MNVDCDCGAATEGKFAGKHAPTCRSLTLAERLENAVTLKTDPRVLENLCAEVLPLVNKFDRAFGPFDDETLQDLQRMVPKGLYDPDGVVTRNPLSQVFFRAGLLACREYMAQFVQAENPAIANSIRQNWWPKLGDDPGAPRLFDFAEVCDEIEGPDGKVSWKARDVPPSVEALPFAYQFLLPAMEGDPRPKD